MCLCVFFLSQNICIDFVTYCRIYIKGVRKDGKNLSKGNEKKKIILIMDEKDKSGIDLSTLGSGKLEFICESYPNVSSHPCSLSTRLKTNRSSYPLRFIAPRTSGNYNLILRIIFSLFLFKYYFFLFDFSFSLTRYYIQFFSFSLNLIC